MLLSLQGRGLLEGGLAFRESSRAVSSWPGSVSTGNTEAQGSVWDPSFGVSGRLAGTLLGSTLSISLLQPLFPCGSWQVCVPLCCNLVTFLSAVYGQCLQARSLSWQQQITRLLRRNDLWNNCL